MSKLQAMVNGRELTYRQFREFAKNELEWFESTSNVLIDFEKEGRLLNHGFCDIYEVLLERRLACCIVCSDYFRAMSEKSFWFMKRLVLKRARTWESLHKVTLQELITLKTYMKLNNY